MKSQILICKGVRSEFDKLISTLEDEYRIHCATSSKEATALAYRVKPDLVLLDLELDNRDGIEVINELRSNPQLDNTLMVLFSDRRENYVHVMALNAGADDFMMKPVNKRVFQSRVKAWLRRVYGKNGHNGQRAVVHDLILDQEKYSLTVKEDEVLLQRKEFEIMSLLFSKPRKVFSRQEIKSMVWGDTQLVRNRTIDVHIRNLRSKIGNHYIKTYKGIGYSFEA